MIQICACVVAILMFIAGLAKESSRPWIIAGFVFAVIGRFLFPPLLVIAAVCELIGVYNLLFHD